MPIQHWLLKTEPSEFAFEDLVARGRETWDGISNPLALKHLRSTRAGDLALIYHTGEERSAVGIARIVGAPYPDPKRKNPSLVVVDLEPVAALPLPVSLQAMKANPKLKGFDLLRISRLSVVPVSAQHWLILMKMSGAGSPSA
jgi:predicted RNA-binding protein with PUA-like domain